MQNIVNGNYLSRLIRQRIESFTVRPNWYALSFSDMAEPPIVHQASRVIMPSGLEHEVSVDRTGSGSFWINPGPLLHLLDSEVASCRIEDDWACSIEFENGCWLTVDTSEPWPE